jgi:predicted phosphodiesterase
MIRLVRGWRPKIHMNLREIVTLARLRRFASTVALVAIAIIGMVLGVLLGGRTSDDLGPFRASYAITPSVIGGTEVVIPPLGSLHLDSHHGPAHLQVRLDALDQNRTRAIVTDPNALTRASDRADDDVARGVRRLIWQVAGCAVLGAMLLAALVYRSVRRVAQCGSVALCVLFATGVTAVATFRADSIQEPRFEGLLTNAPAIVGDARRIATRYEEYRGQLQRMVANVGRIYGTVSGLPVYEPDNTTIRVLHVSDLHLNPAAWSVIQSVVQQFNIDIVVDTGDINDWGSEPEASYVASIGSLKVPYVFVRGNHDSAVTQAAVARQPNARVLDDAIIDINGLHIAGIGDPRFTPDKSAEPTASLDETGQQLAAMIRFGGTQVHIAMVHDPLAAVPLAGACPVVLAGHRHKREVSRLGDPDAVIPAGGRTLLMVQGSTGGAGLRGLEGKEPTPLTLSVLYFDGTEHTLQAYDDITVLGTGEAGVSLQRNIVRPDEAAKNTGATTGPPSESSGNGSPTPR